MIHKERLKMEQNIQILSISNKTRSLNRNGSDITPLSAKMPIVNVGQQLVVCV